MSEHFFASNVSAFFVVKFLIEEFGVAFEICFVRNKFPISVRFKLQLLIPE